MFFVDFFHDMTVHDTNFDVGNLNYCCAWSYERDFEDQNLNKSFLLVYMKKTSSYCCLGNFKED